MLNNFFRLDGWKNFFAGLSGSSDKTQKTVFGNYPIISDDELTAMFIGEGLAKKISSAPADDMTRAWIDHVGPNRNEVQKEFKRLKVRQKFNEALRYKRHFGGSLIFISFGDGKALDKPAPKNPTSIEQLRVYSRSQVLVSTQYINQDINSKNFGELDYFELKRNNGAPIKVHYSRCLVFKGEPVPSNSNRLKFDLRYWGSSVIQEVYSRLANLSGMEQGVANLMLEAIVGKYKIDGLAQILAGGSEKVQQLYKRLEIVNYSKSVINAVLLGEGEEWSRDTANLGGIPDIMDRYIIFLSAVSKIPVTRLFGRSPAGMNATGESDETNYYDFIDAQMEVSMEDPLNMLLDFMRGYMGLVEDDTYKFNPAKEMTLMEQIAAREKQANIDKIYIEATVLDPPEVRESRYGGDEYSFETNITDESALDSNDLEDEDGEE